jgi:hypothetical protein
MLRPITSAVLCAALSFFVLGCGDDDEPTPPLSDALAPPPAGQGVQLQMQASIGVGQENEQCRFVVGPAEGLWVNRDEVRFGAGSHHFLLYETAYDAIPTAKDDGTPIDTSGVFDCSDGATNGWSITRLIGGSQNGSGDSMVSFPEHVAMRVRPGAVLLMNAHYVNATSQVMTPDVRINLWSVPEEQVHEEGDILFWYDLFISVPEMGASTARMRCRVPEDIQLVTAQSHMHRRGVSYGLGFRGEEPFYATDHWENVPVARYPEGFPIAAGSELEYFCNYENSEPRSVYQGPRSTDEMCMLVAAYYPAVPGVGLCSADPDAPLQTNALGAEWVGSGAATCAETFACIQAPGGDFFENLQGCVNAADPAFAREVSDTVRCFMMSGDADPNEVCAAELAACFGEP